MVVRIGSEGKGDCVVEVVADADGVIDLETKSPELLGDGLREVVEGTRRELAADGMSIRLVDAGGLDYVIRARLEAAFRAASPEQMTRLDPESDRAASDRDRWRRSRLYVPGNQPRLLAGIEVHGADCVLVDLEDSVPPSEKGAARILVKHLLAAVRFPEEVWVRINPLETGGRDDVQEVLRGRPHGICLPKASCAGDVVALDDLLSEVEAASGIATGSTWIMPIVETAAGVLRCEEIAACSDRVVMMAFGAEDYLREVGARRTAEALSYPRERLVVAAAAAGVQVSDTVYADVEDETGLAEEAQRARDLGFDGKGAINPRQIEPIHRAFSPTGEEVEQARTIVEAAREAEARGVGAVTVGGRMVDRPIVERALRTIEIAERWGQGGGRHA